MDEIRDIALIAFLIAFSTVALVIAAVMAFVGYKGFRVLRAVRRAHDQGVVTGLEEAQARLAAWREEAAANPARLALRALFAFRKVPPFRRKKKRRRFAFLRR